MRKASEVNDKEMLKLEGFDLEKPETVAADVSFGFSEMEEIRLEMEFPEPKRKTEIKIQHVEFTRNGSSGKRKSLF